MYLSIAKTFYAVIRQCSEVISLTEFRTIRLDIKSTMIECLLRLGSDSGRVKYVQDLCQYRTVHRSQITKSTTNTKRYIKVHRNSFENHKIKFLLKI